jgi:glycosyltransferase involved in cell wall biosynthesis
VLERLPQARLTLAGSGPEEGRLRALAGRLDVTAQVRFAGRLDRDAMAELYRSADLVLNASLADNMPNSLLEAMASGVAIVSTSVGGIPYLVEDGVNARLVPARAAPAMAAAALELLADDALRARLAGAALREVERYRWTGVAPLLASLYRAAMEASPRTAAARAS